jgi:hypothetical protein
VKRKVIEVALSNSDVIVLTSEFEGSPLAILEGMSVGVVPVVMYYGDECTELIQDGVNGVIIRCGGVSTMTDVLVDLSSDSIKLDRMRTAARTASRDRNTLNLWFKKICDMHFSGEGFSRERQTEYGSWIAIAEKVIADLYGDERVAIWGAGEIGRTLFDLISNTDVEDKVVVMVDEKISKYLSNYRNVAITDKAQLANYQIDKIIIASRYYAEEIENDIYKFYECQDKIPLVSRPFAF